jgi:hypothetical protein
MQTGDNPMNDRLRKRKARALVLDATARATIVNPSVARRLSKVVNDARV